MRNKDSSGKRDNNVRNKDNPGERDNNVRNKDNPGERDNSIRPHKDSQVGDVLYTQRRD